MPTVDKTARQPTRLLLPVSRQRTNKGAISLRLNALRGAPRHFFGFFGVSGTVVFIIYSIA